jgi:hypothetical protein
MFPCCPVQGAVHLCTLFKIDGGNSRCQQLVTVPQSAMKVLRAVVSLMMNADERVWKKVRLLAEPARQYGQLKY